MLPKVANVSYTMRSIVALVSSLWTAIYYADITYELYTFSFFMNYSHNFTTEYIVMLSEGVGVQQGSV